MIRDLRLAARALGRRKGFTALAIGVLALGIGANTALFSVIRAVLLRPLPYPHPERMVDVTAPDLVTMALQPKPGFQAAPWLDHLKTLEPIAIVEPGAINYAAGAAPERLAAVEITPAFFGVLGVQPRGRAFTTADASPSARTVIVGDTLAEQLGGSRAALGHRLHLDGRDFTIVGVMPPGVEFPQKTQIWLPMPLPMGENDILSPQVFAWEAYGRLRPGATIAQAQSEIEGIEKSAPHSAVDVPEPVSVVSWRSDELEGAAQMLWLLLAAAAMVLLVACLDVAHLQLARAVDRQREVAIRAALGASRRQLLRQHLSENLLLAVAGGSAGVILAAVFLPVLRRLLPLHLPITGAVAVDGEVLAFAAGVAAVSALVFGMFPVLHAWGVDLRQAMAAGRAPEERAWLRLSRSGLVVGEVALAMILLAGSGLLIESLARMMTQPVGFQPQHLLTANVQLSEGNYRQPERRTQFLNTVLDRVQGLPGVTAAAWTSNLPMSGHAQLQLLSTKEPSPTPMDKRTIYDSAISTDYFRAMGMSLLAGRAFRASDAASPSGVAILSQAAAQLLWPGQNPIGKHVGNSLSENHQFIWLEVVGVVGNVRIGLDPAKMTDMPPTDPAVYYPLAQASANDDYYLVIRSRTAISPVAVRRTVASVDSAQPVTDFASEAVRMGALASSPRLRTTLLGLFAALALLLSAAGIFGALDYWAVRRTREIGVRMALGAAPGAVVRLVLGQGLRLIVVGVALGLAAALALGQVMTAFLFQVRPLNPAILASAALLMAAIGALAAFAPARSAARVDPLAALRAE